MMVCDDDCLFDKYITQVYLEKDDKTASLSEIVDTATFHCIGEFYKDKNHI